MKRKSKKKSVKEYEGVYDPIISEWKRKIGRKKILSRSFVGKKKDKWDAFKGGVCNFFDVYNLFFLLSHFNMQMALELSHS